MGGRLMIAKLLIANRGEIACRVIRTARQMGIRTVAVYSDADRGALHVAAADEAYCIGPALAAESYLNIKAVLAAARDSGADAVHPGYGFLSENAAFAEAVSDAGLIFVGPTAEVIRAMGAKDNAKALMVEAGVPVVPGYHDADQSLATLAAEAEKIGYPVLLKAALGGGGKGMRAVAAAGELEEALVSARREAKAAFGDERMLVEKLLLRPRHVEIQVFADSHGNTVHLFERDCSLQRRHQKVIEEAPAPGVSPELRARMGGAAVAAASAVGYQGAGTIEFLLDGDGSFYFMEMNTRLQVEHPVTEMITGLDLVEWQLRVAAGEALPLSQDDLTITGHAVEARLYAEDPDQGFLPSPGLIEHLVFPAVDRHIRIDAGVAAGNEVSPYYDPMIAKVIAWDVDRAGALARLSEALGGIELVGPVVNRRFLRALVDDPEYRAGAVDTGAVERMDPATYQTRPTPNRTVLASAAIFILDQRRSDAARSAARSGDPHSPWNATDCWRLNDVAHQELTFQFDNKEVVVSAHPRPGGYALDIDGETIEALFDGVAGRVVPSGRRLTVFHDGESYQLTLYDPAALAAEAEAEAPVFAAPMPGRVVAVNVVAGAHVSAGETLIVLEAMKMEHAIKAPVDGTVEAVHYGVGDQVDEGRDLIAFVND